MRAATVAFLASTLVAAVATPLVRDLAHRLGALDHGLTSRKSHGRAVPRIGGVAIVVAFFAPLGTLFFVSSEVGQRFYAKPTIAMALFGGGLAIAALGVLDDLRGTRSSTKLLVQLAVAAAMYFAGFRIDHIAHPFGPAISLGLLGLPFTMLWIAGVINAMNLIDGLDGLAGGVAVIAIGTIGALAVIQGRPLMLLFSAALAGAVIGFLFYNFNPATIFMGDTGSMFLGFILATTSVHTSTKATTTVALVVPILALGVPLADTLFALGRRAIRGAPLFSADRGHLHHRLIDLGLSPRSAVLLIYGGALVLGGAALAVSFSSGPQSAVVLLVLAAMAFVALRALGLLSVERARGAMLERKRNLDMRAAVRLAGEKMSRARTPYEVWSAILDAAPGLGATGAGLALGRLAGRSGSGPWSYGLEDLPEDAIRALYGLIPERPGEDHLELAWTDGRESIHRDTEIAVELLCDHASTALDRIERTAFDGPQVNVIRFRRK